MPMFPYSRVMAAGATDDRPLAGWQFRRVPYRAYVRVLQRSTVATDRQTIFTGSQTIVQRAPIPSGGVAGQTPIHFNTPVTEWIAAGGDEIIISNDNTGLASNIDGVIYVDPA